MGLGESERQTENRTDRRYFMDRAITLRPGDRRRRGVTAVTVAISLPVILGFAALAIDMGYLHNAKIDLQTAVDASALAGASGLAHINNLYVGGTSEEAIVQAHHYAMEFAGANKVAGDGVTLAPNPNNLDGGDVEIGYLADPDDPQQPLVRSNPLQYNAVRVTARRTKGSPGGPIGLFFARALGFDSSELTATATAVLDSRFVTYKPPEGGGGLIPFTVHQDVWKDYIVDRNGPDAFGFGDGHVSSGADTVPELKLYPWGGETAGNFGLLHIGDPGNFSGAGGTPRLADQIENGITQQDLIDFHGEPVIDVYNADGAAQSYDIDGDTGLKTALEEALLTRMGQVVGFFIHDTVAGTGTTSMYHIVRIQFARVMEVELQTGEKRVFVQPTTYIGDDIGTGSGGSSTDGLIGNLRLVR